MKLRKHWEILLVTKKNITWVRVGFGEYCLETRRFQMDIESSQLKEVTESSLIEKNVEKSRLI